MWNELGNFNGVHENLWSTKVAFVASPILLPFIGLWVKRGTEIFPHFLNCILYKAEDVNWNPVLGSGVYTDSNWIAQPLQMAAHKSLETISGSQSWSLAWVQFDHMIHIQSLRPNPSQSKWKAMFESYAEIFIDWMSFDCWFKDFLSDLLL